MSSDKTPNPHKVINYNPVKVEFLAELLCWVTVDCTIIPNEVAGEHYATSVLPKEINKDVIKYCQTSFTVYYSSVVFQVYSLTEAENMASLSSLSLLGFKQLAVHLVDCMKTPADLRPGLKDEQEGEDLP